MSLYLPPQFGLPIRENYGADYDLALLRSNQHSGWVRQRRTWLMNPSLYRFTYRLTLDYANDMMAWLSGAGDEWILLPTATPDTGLPYDCTLLEVRRTSAIEVIRIPQTDLVTLSFSGETRATNLPPVAYPAQWPATFALPRASTFGEVHDARNRTTYSWSFTASTQTLKAMLSFLQYVGTAWFRAPAINSNVPCGWEWVRATSNLAFNLVGPNVWELALSVETMPARWNDDATAPLPPWPPVTGSEYSYDMANFTYDDPALIYDQP